MPAALANTSASSGLRSAVNAPCASSIAMPKASSPAAAVQRARRVANNITAYADIAAYPTPCCSLSAPGKATSGRPLDGINEPVATSASIASPPATHSRGKRKSRSTLQPVAQVTGHEGDAELDILLEAHHLEALAHLCGQGELLDLVGAALALGLVLDLLDAAQHVVHAIAHQEAGLAAVAGEVEARRHPRLGQRGEVHRGGDVLQSRPRQRVAVDVVAVVSAQGAVVALRQVVLLARVAVVDEQHRPALQATGHRLDPVRQLRQRLAAVAVGEAAVHALLQ